MSTSEERARELEAQGAQLRERGELEAARPYFEQALDLRLEALGEGHPDTAASLNTLGSLLYQLGDRAAARLSFERALAIRRQILGEEHADTAQSLNNLGTLLYVLGDLAGARPHFAQALAIFRRTLGEDHPTTRTAASNLRAVDAPAQLQAQHAEEQLTLARQRVERALAEDTPAQQVALAEELEIAAQHYEDGEEEGSPYLTLARQLRELMGLLPPPASPV